MARPERPCHRSILPRNFTSPIPSAISPAEPDRNRFSFSQIYRKSCFERLSGRGFKRSQTPECRPSRYPLRPATTSAKPVDFRRDARSVLDFVVGEKAHVAVAAFEVLTERFVECFRNTGEDFGFFSALVGFRIGTEVDAELRVSEGKLVSRQQSAADNPLP